ncbi:glycosyltransferase family 39 protein [Actinomadura luteofluorescens]|uniref:glycosyltransferase family 39 protein n=1 Tax=Actinomadura luteofluorescens TaxID=46163 RepID=UPI00363666F7
MALAGIGTPSLWLDEAATISMTTRSYGDMLRVFPHLDLVHALYYMIMKPWVAAFGTDALALRLPGALAMAAAAAGVAVIGRRCLGPAAGLAAGLAWAAGPQTSRWAQEARSYAMTAAVAVLATYLLVRALDRDEQRRWPWFAGYAPAVAVLGCLHLDGALLLAAHGVTVLLTRPKAGVWLRWLASASVAAAPLVVLAVAAQDQKRQVKWLPRPSWDVAWAQLQFLTGDRALVAPVMALALLGVVTSVLGRASRPHPTASLPAVALSWALVPTVLLLLVSNVTDPVFYYRYTTYCLPAVALLAAPAWPDCSPSPAAPPLAPSWCAPPQRHSPSRPSRPTTTSAARTAAPTTCVRPPTSSARTPGPGTPSSTSPGAPVGAPPPIRARSDGCATPACARTR